MTSPVPVLVIGCGETALGVLRSFSRSKIPTYVHASQRDFVRFSRWFRPVNEPVGAPLAEVLDRLPFEKMVLCPCSDHAAEAVAALPERLHRRFRSSVPEIEVLRDFVDKGRFGKLLAASGVPAPFTMTIKNESDLERVPDETFPYLMLKPCDSISFFARFGVKAFWGRTRALALQRFRELREVGLEVVAQEYIPGTADCCYLIDGFIDRQGSLRGLLTRRKLRICPQDFGNPTYQISVPTSELAAAVTDNLRLLQQANYRGVFSTLVKWDHRDGRFKFIEVNARPYWYIDFTRRCGVDLPWMLYNDALELPVPEMMSFRVGKRCIYPYHDLLSVRTGQISLWRWLRETVGACQPIFCWDDPMPACAQVTKMAGVRLNRTLHTIGEALGRLTTRTTQLPQRLPLPAAPRPQTWPTLAAPRTPQKA